MAIAEIPPTESNPLFYRASGEGPPVVFIHSYILDSRYWLDHLEGLGGSWRCYAPDLRGHGRSAAEVRRIIREEDDAGDIVAFMRSEVGGGPAHLVGLSGGGIIAALVYTRAPELVKSLTLLSTNFLTPLEEPYKRYQAEMARIAVIEGIDALFRRFNEYIVGSGADLIARARYKNMLAGQPLETVVSFLTGDAIQARPDLPPQLDVPVLLPYGDEDIVMIPQTVAKLLALYPDARTASVPRAGRLLSLENPQALNEALNTFWRSLD